MLKFKMNISKSSTKFVNEKSFDSPSLAWICGDDLVVKSDQEKPSKFAKFKIKNKKNSKKTIEIINGELIVETPRLLNAFTSDFPKSTEENLNRDPIFESHRKNIRKSSTSANIMQLNEESDDIITISPIDIPMNKKEKNQENESNPVIITIISSDESTSDNEIQIKTSKQSRSKAKKKKTKSNIEISDVFYFKNDKGNGERRNSLNPFPWKPIEYRSDFNEDEIIEQTLSFYQMINILIHPIYNDKSILIDLRSYNQYQLNTILSAKHFSEFQDKTGRFSIKKLKSHNYAIVILIDCTNLCEIERENDEKLKIFKLEYTDELESQLRSFISQSVMEKCKYWISFSCFDSGRLLISEHFENSFGSLSEMNIDVLITDSSQRIYKKLSEDHRKRNPNIIPITMNDILGGDFSDKMITSSKLMTLLDHLQTYLFDGSRVLILIEDHDQMSLAILILILMYKNHWSLHDSIACVKYVRSLAVNLKQNFMNVLKNFEKLFFGKRLYSGGNKSKLRQEFALEL